MRGGAFGLIAAIATALIALGAPRMMAGLAILEHEPALRQIQTGRPVALEALIAARRGYETALAWHSGLEERSALASILLYMALELGPRSPAGAAMLEAAREALRAALAARPASAFLWAQLAEAELLREKAGPAFVTALTRSIGLAPNEPSLVPFRARLGLGAWLALDEEARAAVSGQVQAAARISPEALRRFADQPLRRQLVAELLTGQPELYARVFTAGPAR